MQHPSDEKAVKQQLHHLTQHMQANSASTHREAATGAACSAFCMPTRHWAETTEEGLLHCNKVSGVIWQKSRCTSCFQLTVDF